MIALITPTGNRAKQIGLCAKWMKRQTYTGEVLWVIVDDAIPETTDFIPEDFREGWTIKKVHPRPAWEIGWNTQCRNIREGLNIVKQYDVETIYIIEDDDYYFPNYLEVMQSNLKGYVAAAEIDTVYFNVSTMIPIYNHNRRHGSLFQTAFTPDVLPLFESVLEKSPRFIDMEFWKLLQGTNINLFTPTRFLSVGIKGMPGRPGIGAGHVQRYVTTAKGDVRAEKIKLLKSLIGLDYLLYL